MSDFTIYHNPRCSKSRQTLEILRENDVDPTVIEYLKVPPTAEELKRLLEQLNMEPADLLRRKEEAYRGLKLADHLDEPDVLIDAMVENPKLIERPIVVRGDKAVIGRPPENVRELL